MLNLECGELGPVSHPKKNKSLELQLQFLEDRDGVQSCSHSSHLLTSLVRSARCLKNLKGSYKVRYSPTAVLPCPESRPFAALSSITDL